MVDQHRFDNLTRAAGRSTSRRGVLKAMLGTAFAGLAGASRIGGVDARDKDPQPGADGKDGKGKSNADCAHFCKDIYPPGSDRGHCTSDAAHGQGLCPQCGGDTTRVCRASDGTLTCAPGPCTTCNVDTTKHTGSCAPCPDACVAVALAKRASGDGAYRALAAYLAAQGFVVDTSLPNTRTLTTTRNGVVTQSTQATSYTNTRVSGQVATLVFALAASGASKAAAVVSQGKTPLYGLYVGSTGQVTKLPPPVKSTAQAGDVSLFAAGDDGEGIMRAFALAPEPTMSAMTSAAAPACIQGTDAELGCTLLTSIPTADILGAGCLVDLIGTFCSALAATGAGYVACAIAAAGYCVTADGLNGIACDKAAEALCTCPDGSQNCNGTCPDYLTDANNCGGCGAPPCLAGETCINGKCICPNGQSRCNGKCIDTTSDPNNCGGCGGASVCKSGQICQNSQCVNPCPGDQPYCGGAGICCTAAQICHALTATTAECACPSGTSTCPGGKILNPKTCKCECSGQFCVAPLTLNPTTCLCECPGGGAMCNGTCCPAGQTCTNGRCGGCQGITCISPHVLDPISCTCGCLGGNQTCPPGQVFHESTCVCDSGCINGAPRCNGSCCASNETCQHPPYVYPDYCATRCSTNSDCPHDVYTTGILFCCNGLCADNGSNYAMNGICPGDTFCTPQGCQDGVSDPNCGSPGNDCGSHGAVCVAIANPPAGFTFKAICCAPNERYACGRPNGGVTCSTTPCP